MPFFGRAYLFLLLLRVWFALSPSYLHPDENFQGPEVIAGEFDNIPWCSFPLAPADMFDRHICKGGLLARNPIYKASLLTICRSNLQLSCQANLGIYIRKSDSKCLPAMADLWSANATSAMALDRKWK